LLGDVKKVKHDTIQFIEDVGRFEILKRFNALVIEEASGKGGLKENGLE
jgi:hypothetical protein